MLGQGKYMDTYIKGVNKPYWARNDELTASQTGMALGGVERSQLRERLTERGITTTPHVVSSRNYVNVIKYNPSYSFIYHKVMNEVSQQRPMWYRRGTTSMSSNTTPATV